MKPHRVNVRVPIHGGPLRGQEFHIRGLVPAQVELVVGVCDGHAHFGRYVVETMQGVPVGLAFLGSYAVPFLT